MDLFVNGNRLFIVVSLSEKLAHRIEYSLGCERECSVLLGFWKAGRRVRSNSGPEVKIGGRGILDFEEICRVPRPICIFTRAQRSPQFNGN